MSIDKRFIVGLLITILICWFGYFYFEEKLFFNNKILLVKRLMRFARIIWLILVAIIGFWVLIKVRFSWMKKLWAISYSFIILLLIFIGVFDMLFGPINENFRFYISCIRLFFASPLTLALMYFFYKKTNKELS